MKLKENPPMNFYGFLCFFRLSQLIISIFRDGQNLAIMLMIWYGESQSDHFITSLVVTSQLVKPLETDLFNALKEPFSMGKQNFTLIQRKTISWCVGNTQM